jgi:hypothetical protein
VHLKQIGLDRRRSRIPLEERESLCARRVAFAGEKCRKRKKMERQVSAHASAILHTPFHPQSGPVLGVADGLLFRVV